MLAFEPIDLGPVLGVEPGHVTMGALLATNLSGARRVAGGGVRDHALGLQAVTGAGQPFRAGGRVMKNVTGYDLTRGLSGSWGTLAVLTEVTFKLMPVPEETGTLVLFGLEDEIAVEALCTAMATPYEVSGAVHLQQALAARLWHASTRAQQKSVTAIRVENFSRSVAYRTGRLKDTLKPYGEVHQLDHTGSLAFWDELRQLSILQQSDAPVWRISRRRAPDRRSLPPSRAIWTAERSTTGRAASSGPRFSRRRCGRRRHPPRHGCARRACDAHPRRAAGTCRRRGVSAVEPSLAEISRGIKAVFDPAGILNPGRMYADA